MQKRVGDRWGTQTTAIHIAEQNSEVTVPPTGWGIFQPPCPVSAPGVSLYVYRGIVEWSTKWHCHGWRTSSGEMGYRDLWEQMLWECERAGDELQIRWVPSHLGVRAMLGWINWQNRVRGRTPMTSSRCRRAGVWNRSGKSWACWKCLRMLQRLGTGGGGPVARHQVTVFC